jgi:plastocyanin
MLARRSLILSFLAVAICLVPAARAATVNVVAGGAGLVFTPATVTINVGDTVTWTNGGGFHNVRSDDGSFGNSISGSWTLSHTYTTAGTFGFHCEAHGSAGSGMFGTVTVQGGGNTSHPGTLGFSLASYFVGEGNGSATIAVQRLGGDDGAVSVHYAATAGSATAGQDFTAVSGTLSWGDKDHANKTFTVPVINNTSTEPIETVLLALSSPAGGATLDAAHTSATLSIQDDDPGSGGGPVAAPTNLTATAASTSEIDLAWSDNSNNETGFSIERRAVGGTYQVVATTGTNVHTAAVTGLDPAAFSLFRVRAIGTTGITANSPYSTEAAAATLADIGACVPGTNALCLTGGRFKASVDWHTSTDTGPGFAIPLPAAPQSGLFYFFDPTNIEMLIKVLNACVPPFNHYWVFFAATTNVEFAVVVADTQTGKTVAYFNPLNRSAPPVQDVNAFATCP